MRILTFICLPILLTSSMFLASCAGNSSVHTSAYYGVGYDPYYYSRWNHGSNIIVVPPQHPNRPVRPQPPHKPKPPARPPAHTKPATRPSRMRR